MKVLHVLYQSFPDISGSSVRSRDILMSQKVAGISVLAITSPFQKKLKKNVEIINGCIYIRTNKTNENYHISDEEKPVFVKILKLFKIVPFVFKLYGITKKTNPDVLHAHATFFCAISSVVVGKILKIPVIYEVRSIWEEINLNSNPSKSTKISIKIIRVIEKFAMQQCDNIVAINYNLKNTLIAKEIAPSKIIVVPNAVNTLLIEAYKEHSKEIKNRNNELVFGYIGTLTPYEGLGFLIETFIELEKRNFKFKLFIYGKGIDEENIKKQIIESKSNNIFFKGSVNPKNIIEAFDSVDIIVNPRVSNYITNNVTPLKPLEAMAYEKLVIVSNVGGMLELVEHMKTGIVFEAENKQSLINAIFSLPESDEREKIIKTAKKFVYDEKSWSSNAKTYIGFYEKTLNEYYSKN